ncbi:threonine aspartase 1-like [Planoprotostelium fungivorum]|uniref:Threonine aspartase 1-like n=1 Tax=Planoprotostelium fungivorum TaxID=1890364 RepID=A0A2P6P060_9EUKA|nr:threonine aspartase 1-like [Planoprotostelium fungivorum]
MINDVVAQCRSKILGQDTRKMQKRYSRGVRTGNWVEAEAEALPPIASADKTFVTSNQLNYRDHTGETTKDRPYYPAALDRNTLFGHGPNQDEWRKGRFTSTYQKDIDRNAESNIVAASNNDHTSFGRTSPLQAVLHDGPSKRASYDPESTMRHAGVGPKNTREITGHMDSPLAQMNNCGSRDGVIKCTKKRSSSNGSNSNLWSIFVGKEPKFIFIKTSSSLFSAGTARAPTTGNMSKFFVAVHIGAGNPSEHKRESYEEVMRRALSIAAKILGNNGDSLDAVTEAIAVMEDDPSTNSGTGSNMTEQGTVECDASIMSSQLGAEGRSGAFGAVGAISGMKNPIRVAKALLTEEKKGRLPLGRIRPIFLVGAGATLWATEHGLEQVDPFSLTTEDSRKTWNNHTERVNRHKRSESDPSRKRPRIEELARKPTETKPETIPHESYDTVGAVCLDSSGSLCAGVSSGGISLKYSGRVGEAAHYGSGCWAKTSHLGGLACSTTGAGEQIMKSMLASRLSHLNDDMDSTIPLEELLRKLFENEFLEVDTTRTCEKRLGGIISVRTHNEGKDFPTVEFAWGHTTEGMGLGWQSSDGKGPQMVISKMKKGDSGSSVYISGTSVSL